MSLAPTDGSASSNRTARRRRPRTLAVRNSSTDDPDKTKPSPTPTTTPAACQGKDPGLAGSPGGTHPVTVARAGDSGTVTESTEPIDLGGDPPRMSHAVQTVVRAFYLSYNEQDLDATFERYVDVDLINHAQGGHLSRADWKAFDKAIFASFTDVSFTVLDQVAEDDKVATRWAMTATQVAEFHGVPSAGRTETVTATSVDRVRAGKIVEHWLDADLTGFLHRLGAAAGDGQAA